MTLFSFFKQVELLHAEGSEVKMQGLCFTRQLSFAIFYRCWSARLCVHVNGLSHKTVIILRFASAPWMAVFNSFVRYSEILSGASLWCGGSVTSTSVAEIARSV